LRNYGKLIVSGSRISIKWRRDEEGSCHWHNAASSRSACLLRGRLTAGETLVAAGATGAYGTAAVMLGVAMGAGTRLFPLASLPEAMEAVAVSGNVECVVMQP
jgi:hypothetical protein